MGRFTAESLEKLRERVDLIELISSHIDLKRAGASYKALCPFHDEKSPSFMVQRGDTHYHCFGCGAHGDAIAFLMNYLRLGFVEAVEYLSEKFSVQVERTEERETGPSRKRMKEVLKAASDLYHTLLLHTPEGHEALQYLYERGLDLEFLRRFRVGLAPQANGVVLKCLHEQKFDNGLLREAGILSQRGQGREFFHDRILFPICDAAGAVIGFSGRKYKETTTGGKYINTPDTPLFHKSRVLFGLNHSRRRIAKEQRAVVVEGQIDALRLIHAGLDLAVAGQGTAFGAGQVEELLQLGVREVFLAMDGDSAGQEAAAKVGDLFQRKGVGVKVTQMPPGTDPDAILSAEGAEGFLRVLRQSVDYLPFLVEHVGRQVKVETPAGKTELVRRLSGQIRAWEDPVMIHESLRRLASLTQLPEEAVGVGVGYRPSFYQRRSGPVQAVTFNADQVLEADCLRWILLLGDKEEWVMELARANLTVDDFRVEGCRKVFEVYLKNEAPDLLALAAKVGDEEVIDQVLDRRINPDRAKDQFPEAVRKVLERNWMDQREALRQKIQSGQEDDDRVLKLVKEFEELKRSTPEVVWPT